MRRLVHAAKNALIAITEEDLKQAFKRAMDKGGSLMVIAGEYLPEEYSFRALGMLRYFPRLEGALEGAQLDPKEFMGELSRSINEFLGKWCRRSIYLEACERKGRCSFSALYECSVPDLGDFYVRVKHGYERWGEATYDVIVPTRERCEAELQFKADLREYLRKRRHL